jgi:hypothetical protein
VVLLGQVVGAGTQLHDVGPTLTRVLDVHATGDEDGVGHSLEDSDEGVGQAVVEAGEELSQASDDGEGDGDGVQLGTLLGT